MSVNLDVSELVALANDLERAAIGAQMAAAPVVAKAAFNVKRDWRANATASSGSHAKRYPYSIGYDLEDGGLTAIVGPDKDRPQGPLGNLLEYGSAHNPPHNDGGRAMDAEAPRFEENLLRVARKLL